MKVTFLSLFILPSLGFCQASTVRFWFAYGDEATAQLAKDSGIDSNAAIGREITGGRLAVPISELSFKVSLWCEMAASDGLPEYNGGPTVHLAFDRTYSGEFGQNPPLNADSFRKVRPAGVNQNDYIEAFSNGAIVPAWRNSEWISDWDNDGVQDMAQIGYLQDTPSAWRQGVQGSGVSLRPIGLASFLSANLINSPVNGFQQGFKLPNATPFRLIDVNWVSMLNLGETYGDREGETGLSITTSPVIGLANTTAIVDGSHTGSRYTLVAVAPEPGAGVVFGIGALLLLRKRVAGG